MSDTSDEMAQRSSTVLPEGDDLDSLTAYMSRECVLELALRLSVPVSGNIMEFGVFQGHSTRFLRRSLTRNRMAGVPGPRKQIFALDSFQGLQEKFENAEVGMFACDPPKARGVRIVEGYFEESLTPELAAEVGQVSFVSLDADLYTSTLCALRWLTPLLHTGSLLLFDEFLGEKESERRAFEEWRDETGTQTVLIGEFARPPSGFGDRPDKRVLFQVVGEDELPGVSRVGLFLRRVRRRLGSGMP